MTTTLATPSPVPDLSFLAGLDKTVALAALATIVITMTLIYLGPAIRERLRPAPPTPQVEPAGTAPQPPTVVAAVAQADDRTDRFIAHLQQQVADLSRDNNHLRTDLDRERAETERLQTELDRATWRRGKP